MIIMMANIYQQNKKVDDEEKILSEGFESYPGDSNLSLRYSDFYVRKGNHSIALRILEDTKNNSLIQIPEFNYKLSLCYFHLKSYKEALKYSIEALKTLKEPIEVTILLGRIYLKFQNTDSAIESFQCAIESNKSKYYKDSAKANLFLGISMLVAKKYFMGCFYINKASEINELEINEFILRKGFLNPDMMK